MTDISKIGMNRIEGLNDVLDNSLNNKQDISNLSQTLDDSTTKYPSNKAVVDYSAQRHQVVDALPENPDPETFYYIPVSME